MWMRSLLENFELWWIKIAFPSFCSRKYQLVSSGKDRVQASLPGLVLFGGTKGFVVSLCHLIVTVRDSVCLWHSCPEKWPFTVSKAAQETKEDLHMHNKSSNYGMKGISEPLFWVWLQSTSLCSSLTHAPFPYRAPDWMTRDALGLC